MGRTINGIFYHIVAIETVGVGESSNTSRLKRPIGLLDLTGFYVISALSLRWIATASAVGPGAITLWLVAWALFFLPLASSVLVLSRRYPAEGGLYVWAKHAFGDFAGFLAGWTYWMSNLPYFPAVLYFAAGSLLFARRGAASGAMANNSVYFVGFSVGCLALITSLNVVGLKWSKWLNNLGAAGVWLPLMALTVFAGVLVLSHGPATPISPSSLIPHAGFKDAIFWSTIAFAFGGCEAASFMGDEIENPRKNIPRALFWGGLLVTVGYIGGTVAMLAALPAEQIRGLGGFMLALDHMCAQLGLGVLVPAIAILVAVSNVGSASAYLTATARLPFVAGLDAHLPSVFGTIHPRFGTPYIAILSYGAAGALFALLGQAGSSVKAAYDVLVSMSVLTYFIPYGFLFAAVLRLERAGRFWVRGLALMGLFTTLVTLVLAAVPAADDPDKTLTIAKTLGATLAVLLSGVGVYAASARRQRLAP